jgi:ATP-dependent exoDNAse (exonuclease V) beta subunit
VRRQPREAHQPQDRRDLRRPRRAAENPLNAADDRHLITERLDDTLVVEAAAGTGKTTELVARIVALIETGRARVTEIVAVTFSEKAAGELKLRLREELERARVAARPGSNDAARLDEAVREFEEAHVSTIHGFCAELLRERPVEAAIDPAFDVMTQSQSDQLFDEAFRAWMETALKSPGEGVKRSLRRPRQPSWWRDDAEEEGPVARLRKAGYELLQWRDHPAPWKHPVWDRAAMIESVVQSVLDVADLTASPIYERDIVFLDTRSLRRAAREIRRLADAGARSDAGWDYDGIEAQLVTLAGDRELGNKRKGGGAMYSRAVARQVVVDKRAALVRVLKNFKAVADADLVAHLHAELQSCMASYDERKRRTGVLDFLDLLIRARDLVRDCEPVRRAFQQRFRFILVDEFQDTDPLQAELLLMLASDERGRRRPGALFIVGDPKQSIYRFRRADVGIYQEVCEDLQRGGASAVQLKQSFRSVPNIQRFVNIAFRGEMTYDAESLQASYVELMPHRAAIDGQPSVVALPVPRPYGKFRLSKQSIDHCLPDAVAEFVRWLLKESGWNVTAAGEAPRPIGASDVCLLFRRFIAYQDDVTRAYVEALEARGVPHLLVGGKTFHEREEVDALRTALAAIEWPEDELSIFATLRGPLFALGDEELLEYHAIVRASFQGHAFHPYRIPKELPGHLAPIGEALTLIRELHAGRNYRPVADTIGRLIERTRAHAGFMLWRGGEQVLANVLQIAELARQYETEGGLSFRGFVDTLRTAADRAQAPEAPILEEGSEGVRLMTVHKAKGLEFPVVVLADISCGLSRDDAQRYLDAERKLCAVKLAGWAPLDLIENNDREAKRDRAEGVRLAYVAATRARDLLVVPAVGDEPFDDGWVSPLNNALYPDLGERQSPKTAVGCPPFKGKDTVLERPDGDQPGTATVRPGQYEVVDPVSHERATVVWWDPLLIDGKGDDTRGLRRDDLISKDARPEDVAADRARYDAWVRERVRVRDEGSKASLRIVTATEWALDPDAYRVGDAAAVQVIDAGFAGERPSGKRFGVLVHALLAAVPLDASGGDVEDLARLHAKVLGATDAERDEAARVVARVVAHPVLTEARAAEKNGRACRREAAVSIVVDGTLVDGQVDLAFEHEDEWVVVDFKTDAEIGMAEESYRRQVALYAHAIAEVTGRRARGLLLRV